MGRRFTPREVALGTWGYGPFDSDYAQDFLDELAGMVDVPGHLHAVLSRVADEPDRVGTFAGEDAAAAAALVAVRSGGLTIDPETEEDLARITFECPEDLRSLADRTFTRLMDPVDNEWYDLWVLSNGIDQVKTEFEPFRRAVAPK